MFWTRVTKLLLRFKPPNTSRVVHRVFENCTHGHWASKRCSVPCVGVVGSGGAAVSTSWETGTNINGGNNCTAAAKSSSIILLKNNKNGEMHQFYFSNGSSDVVKCVSFVFQTESCWFALPSLMNFKFWNEFSPIEDLRLTVIWIKKK